MTHEGEFVLPGLRVGNVLIAPQPPRGWEINEEVLHANMSVPPTHQYLAFYYWLQNNFDPHAIIHHLNPKGYEQIPPRDIKIDEIGDYSIIKEGVDSRLQTPYEKVEIFWPREILKNNVK